MKKTLLMVLFTIVCIVKSTAQCTPTPQILGNFLSPCASTYIYQSYTTDVGMSDYTWSTSAGGVIKSGQGTHAVQVQWTASGPQTISVNYTNTSGCRLSTPVTRTIANVILTPPPSISGNATATVNSTNNIYTTDAGKSAYSWAINSIPFGLVGDITAGGSTNSIRVTWNTVGTYVITASYIDPATSCMAVNYYAVTVTLPPLPIFGGSNTVCSNSVYRYSTVNGKTSYNWTITGGSILSGNGTNFITVKWTGPGTLGLNYVEGGNTSPTTTRNFTLNSSAPLPVPTIFTTTTDVCERSFVTYSTESSMTSYDWQISSGGNISSSNGNSVSVLWNTSGPQTISVNYVNSDGCSASTSTTKNVSVTPVPLPSISGGKIVCPAGSTGVTYTTESGKSSYTWGLYSMTFPSGTQTPLPPALGQIVSGNGTNSVSINWPAEGTYALRVMYDGPIASCPAYSTAFIAVKNSLPPTGVYPPAPAPFCSGQSVQLSTNWASSTSYFYQWKKNGVPIVGATSSSYNAAQSGSYTLTVSESESCQQTSAPQVVTAHAIPVATATGQTICSEQLTNIQLNSTVPNTTFNYIVKSVTNVTGAGSGTGSTIAQTLRCTSASPGTVVYSVYPSANNCDGQPIDVSVTVNPKPFVTKSTPVYPSICGDTPLNIALTCTTPSTFVWTAADNPNTTGESLTPQTGGIINNTITNSTATAQTVTYNITSTATTGGCVGNNILEVPINPRPVMTSASTKDVCTGAPFSTALTSSTPVGFFWQATDNPNTSGETNWEQYSASLSGTITNATTVVQNVTYAVRMVSHLGNCVRTENVIIAVVPKPTVTSSTNPSTVCSGYETIISALTASVPSAFSWIATDNSNVTGESLTLQNGAAINDVLTNTANSTQSVAYNVTPTSNQASCVGTSQTITATVYAKASLSSPTTITACSGAPLNIPLSSSYPSPSFTWVATDNPNISGESTTTQSGSVINNTVVNLTAAPQTLHYAVTTVSAGCVGVTQLVTVTVNPSPVIFTPGLNQLTTCSGDQISLPFASNVASTTYSVTSQITNGISGAVASSSGFIGTAIRQTLYTRSPDHLSGTVTYTFTGQSNGCPSSSSMVIVVTVNPKPEPVLSITDNATFCRTGSVTLSTAAIEAGSSYQWIADGTPIATTTTETFSVSTTGRYTVKVTNSKNCYNISNDIIFNADVCGEALNFNRTNSDQVQIPEKNGRLNFGTGPFVIEAFIYPKKSGSSYNEMPILSKRNEIGDNTKSGFVFGIDVFGLPYIAVLYGTTMYPYSPSQYSKNLFDGTCHHVAVRRSGTTFSFFIDGVFIGDSRDKSSANVSSPGRLLLGRYPAASSHKTFSGWIGEVRFWNTDLSNAQLAANVQGITTPQQGLVGFYDMKDDIESKTLTDLSTSDPLMQNNGMLGTTGSGLNDPDWLTKSQVTCNVGGNFRSSIDTTPIALPALVEESSKIFPIPSDEFITIDLAEPVVDKNPIKVVDLNNREVLSDYFEKGEQTKTLNTKNIVTGVYILVIKKGDDTIRKKILILHNATN